jgi:hypothetical protein
MRCPTNKQGEDSEFRSPITCKCEDNFSNQR